MTTAASIRWGRILVGGILLEAILLVLAVPLLALVVNPFNVPAEGTPAGDYTAFFTSVTVACLIAGALAGRWVARPLASGFALHGALTGVIATAIYLGICSIPPTTVAAVFAAYGPFWFLFANGVRIGGAALGAASRGRRA